MFRPGMVIPAPNGRWTYNYLNAWGVAMFVDEDYATPAIAKSVMRDVVNELNTKGMAMNRFELFHAMITRLTVTLANPNGKAYTGIINGLRMEDGSGHNFIVELSTSTGTKQIFVRSQS